MTAKNAKVGDAVRVCFDDRPDGVRGVVRRVSCGVLSIWCEEIGRTVHRNADEAVIMDASSTVPEGTAQGATATEAQNETAPKLAVHVDSADGKYLRGLIDEIVEANPPPSTPVPGDSELARLAREALTDPYAKVHFYRTANPKAVLDLIARLEAAQRLIRDYHAHCTSSRSYDSLASELSATEMARDHYLRCWVDLGKEFAEFRRALESRPTQTADFDAWWPAYADSVRIKPGLRRTVYADVARAAYAAGRASVPTQMPTKEQIAAAIYRGFWPNGTFPDADHGPNERFVREQYLRGADAVLSLVTEGTRPELTEAERHAVGRAAHVIDDRHDRAILEALFERNRVGDRASETVGALFICQGCCNAYDADLEEHQEACPAYGRSVIARAAHRKGDTP